MNSLDDSEAGAGGQDDAFGENRGQSRPPRGWSSRLRRWVMMLGSTYFLLLLLLLLFEPMLVYPGTMRPMSHLWENTTFEHEEVEFYSKDGTKLCGWFLPRAGTADDGSEPRTFLLCYGNADNVANFSNRMGSRLRNDFAADVFVFDYRGYGKSEGSPFEQGVLEDAEAAMKWLNEKTGTKAHEIVVLGHSLGGGVAVHVASKMGAKALILQRTFDSLANVAQNRFWWFPVESLIRNRFPSEEKIAGCSMPLMSSHGTADRNVPFRFGHRLFESSPAKLKEFYTIEGGNHHSKLDAAYFETLGRFLRKVDDQTETSDR